MEQNINIAEILKDKPKGTKLYSPLFGEVGFSEIVGSNIFVVVTDDDKKKMIKSFSRTGNYYSNYLQAECLLFPSSQMRNWSKFAWKKGDVLVSRDRDVHVIFEKFTDNTYTAFRGKYYYYQGNGKNRYNPSREHINVITENFSIETEKINRLTYINYIEEKLGGKLNCETLEIDKQPKFKDGDIMVMEEDPYKYYSKCIFILKGDIKINNQIWFMDSYLFYNINNDYLESDISEVKIEDEDIRLATDSEKQQLFDALKKKGKAWDAEKKQIVNLPKKHEFQPFEKVLVRDEVDEAWHIDLFECMPTDNHKDYHRCTTGCRKYMCMNGCWKFCIPCNENTKHLLGTTDEWKENKDEE